MYLQQQHRRGPALVPVATCTAVMVLAAAAALVLAGSAPSPVVQVLAALGVLALVGVRLTAARARAWWARPVPGTVRRSR